MIIPNQTIFKTAVFDAKLTIVDYCNLLFSDNFCVRFVERDAKFSRDGLIEKDRRESRALCRSFLFFLPVDIVHNQNFAH
jgi:hypothetical protein